MPQHLLYEENSFGVFLLVTLVLGGGTAWLSGRAIAQTWRPWWSVVAYMLVLGAIVRFFHFALFGGTLLSAAFLCGRHRRRAAVRHGGFSGHARAPDDPAVWRSGALARLPFPRKRTPRWFI